MNQNIPHVERFRIAYSLNRTNPSISYKPEENGSLASWLIHEFIYKPNQWPVIERFATQFSSEYHTKETLLAAVFKQTHCQWSCFSSRKWRDWCKTNVPSQYLDQFADDLLAAYNKKRIEWLEAQEKERIGEANAKREYEQHLIDERNAEKTRVANIIANSIKASTLYSEIAGHRLDLPVIIKFLVTRYDYMDQPYEEEHTTIIKSIETDSEGRITLIANEESLSERTLRD